MEFPNQNEEYGNEEAYDEGIETEDGGSPENASKRKEVPKSADSSVRGSRAKKKNPSTRSWVWEHYTREPDNRNICRCHYCGRSMACATANGTTCLKNHLEICKEYQAWNESNQGQQHVLHREGEGDDESSKLKLSKCSESVFREASNEMLVLGELPLSFIESLAWKHFCSRVKLYKPHSRRTATRDIVEMYVRKKEAMMKLLKSNKQRVSLTTDIWVAPTTGASYMVITAHFIDASWQLRKLIIGFKHISDHTGTTICYVLLECLAEWGIRKVFTITVDNATANTNAMEKFVEAFCLQGIDALVLGGELLHLRCCAHILNLVVKDGLGEVENSVSAIRNAVQYVRSSSRRLESFEHKVDSGKMTRGSLSLDCKTRWNSTYLMLARALKFRSAFDRMENEDKLYNDYFDVEVSEGKTRIGPPSVNDWDEVERLVKFLVIFYNSTLVVSASSTVNSYKCYNEIVTIQKNLISLKENPDKELKVKAEAMKDKFDKYWGGLKKINKLLIIASVFDPRNKMKFAGYCFDMLYGKDSPESKEVYESVYNVLKDLFDEYNRAVTRTGTASSSQSSQSQNHSRNNSQDTDKMDFDVDGYERMDMAYSEMVKETGFQDSSTELELYLKEKIEIPKANPLGIQFDVLGWWRINSAKYPVLSTLAKDLLAMQVSSVASESAFSTSNRILDPFRSCLTHYMVEVLMCTEQWLKCEIRINERGVVTCQQMLADLELQDDLQKEYDAPRNLEDY